MAKYYGIVRTKEYLAHYGVKGMKWGVQKAKEKNDSKALAKHYKKATKKLVKLSRKENVEINAADAKRYGRIAKNAALIGFGGATGSQVASRLLKRGSKIADTKHREAAQKWWDQVAELRKNNGDLPDHITLNDPSLTPIYETAKKYRDKELKLHNYSVDAETYRNLIGGAGLGIAAITGGKAALNKYRASTKGHAKAVKNRENWEKEMRQAFKGTKYASLPGAKEAIQKDAAKQKRNRAELERYRKNRKEYLKQDLRDGVTAAFVGPFVTSSRRAVVGDGRSLVTGKRYSNKKKRK